MDPYATKFASMQLFVPFLDKTIRKLERAGDRSKEAQLNKMKSLHGILTDPQKKVRLEVLEKCDDVLRMLYEKVEGQPWPHGGTDEGRCSSTPKVPSPEPSGWRGQGPGPPPRGPQVRRGPGLLGDGPDQSEGPVHQHQKGGRPEPWSQPGNLQNRPWSEGRGPNGGFGPPMNRKDSRRQSRDEISPGNMRDGSAPRWDGPGPEQRFLRDGSEESRDGPGPMRNGPGPMRDGFRPMRDGPGPMRDGPGPMRDESAPMREWESLSKSLKIWK